MRLGRSLMAFSIAAFPALAAAQRGVDVRGERAGNVGGRGFSMPRASDLEDHSPVGVALDRRKKLALADSQVTALKGIAKTLHEKNADFYRMWDSVRVAMRALSTDEFANVPPGGGRSRSGGRSGGSAGGDASGGAAPSLAADNAPTARSRMQLIMQALRESDDWSRQQTLQVLSPEQQAKLEQFWKEDADEFRKSMPGGQPPRP